MKLLDLPDDVLVSILGKLDFWSIVSCEISSRTFRQLVEYNARLAYIKESLRCGRTPIFSDSKPAWGLLASLREHEQGWRNLTSAFTSSPIEIYTEGGPPRVIDTWPPFAVTDRYIIWSQFFPNVGSYSATHSALWHAVCRYDMITGTLESSLQIHTASKSESVLAVDPDQDLLVWIHDEGNAYCIHLVSLSTGEPRPEAQFEERAIEKDAEDDLADKPIRFSEDFILFAGTADESGPVLYIISWKKTRGNVSPQKIRGSMNATFLSNNIVIYDIPRSMLEIAKVSIEKTHAPSGEQREASLRVRRIVRIRLPDDLLPSPSHFFDPIDIALSIGGVNASNPVFLILPYRHGPPVDLAWKFFILAIDGPALLTSPRFHALSAFAGESDTPLTWRQWRETIPTSIFGPFPLMDGWEGIRANAIGNRLVVNTDPIRTYECFPPRWDASADPQWPDPSHNPEGPQIPFRERVHEIPESCCPKAIWFSPSCVVLWDPRPCDPPVPCCQKFSLLIT